MNLNKKKIKLNGYFLFMALSSLFPINLFGFSSERITSFVATIKVNSDASLTVNEQITMTCYGHNVKRGIYRDFPTRYKDHYGISYNIHFNLLSTTCDNKSIDNSVKSIANGKRIYLGNKDRYIPHGTHTFGITYKTNRQIGFFDKHDELYWNVTGNAWNFNIDDAQCIIKLPQTIPSSSLTIDGYTGYQGEQGKNYKSRINNDGSIVIETTEPLWINQGLTVSITFPKGILKQPSTLDRARFFITDNINVIVAFGLLLLLVCLYLFLFIRYKRSWKSYPSIPLFYPPQDFLPSQVSYLVNMKYDSQALTSEIVNMACLGFLTIEYKRGSLFSSDSYTLHKTENLAIHEVHRLLLRCLFTASNSLHLEKHTLRMQSAKNYLEGWLQGALYSYIEHLQEYVIIGGIASYIIGAILLLSNEVILIVFMIVTTLVHGVFYFLMKQYSDVGNKLMADINGFKLFLTVTEVDRLHAIGTPPTRTPELYEHYLPYAMALGVEKQWTAQFGTMFKNLEQAGTPYIPLWCMGYAMGSFNANTFSRNLSTSLNSYVTAAASMPSSRTSGSGGRGSSGGGGGGGGGGGW